MSTPNREISDAQLAVIEAAAREGWNTNPDTIALVAEVRSLRGRLSEVEQNADYWHQVADDHAKVCDERLARIRDLEAQLSVFVGVVEREAARVGDINRLRGERDVLAARIEKAVAFLDGIADDKASHSGATIASYVKHLRGALVGPVPTPRSDATAKVVSLQGTDAAGQFLATMVVRGLSGLHLGAEFTLAAVPTPRPDFDRSMEKFNVVMNADPEPLIEKLRGLAVPTPPPEGEA
jgi:hypothetical protein